MTVLLADEIKKLCIDDNGKPKEKPLIEPFIPSQLRSASYQLTLGENIHLGGEKKHLRRNNVLILKPHQVAVVSTRESINMPRHLIARWSLRVTNIYEGLLWTGGPQVDPGWEGSLFCPIYNLSEREVVLKYAEPMFTMDFVRTTPVTSELYELKEIKEYSKVWFSPIRKTLEEHDTYRIHSAPYEALRDLKELSNFRTFANIAMSMMILVLTVLVGALAVIAGTDRVEFKVSLSEASFWGVIGSTIFVGLLSAGISIWSFFKVRKIL